MAESQTKLTPEPKREPREPRALSAEYHKARKQLMLWAGILFIWELVGIDLEKAKEAGGNAGAIIGAIKSPQAVPWALLILVAYFLFKVIVEWYQCSLIRRRMLVARIDLVSSAVVGLVAYALYVGQAISRAQLADFLAAHSTKAYGMAYGFLMAIFISVGVYLRWNARTLELDRAERVGTWLIISLGTVTLTAAILLGLDTSFFLLGALIGLCTGGLSLFVSRRWQRIRPMFSRSQRESPSS